MLYVLAIASRAKRHLIRKGVREGNGRISRQVYPMAASDVVCLSLASASAMLTHFATGGF
jgi:hypothetical protein